MRISMIDSSIRSHMVRNDRIHTKVKCLSLGKGIE